MNQHDHPHLALPQVPGQQAGPARNDPPAQAAADHAGTAAGGQQLNDEALSECVRAVATCLRDAGLRPDPEAYATLVQLVYDRAKLTGRIDEPYINKLIGLARGGR